MFRKIYCYLTLILEIVYITSIVYEFVNPDFLEYTMFCIIMVLFTFHFCHIIIGAILFGAPSNNPKEYKIKFLSYKDVIKQNNTVVVNCNEKGVYEFSYREKIYSIDCSGWINIRKRVSDILFIQFHNNYCNCNEVKHKYYYKNFFKKYKVKILFVKKNKKKIKSFKPSIILKFKMIIVCSRFPHQKYDGDEIVKRSMSDTFWV